MTSLLSPQQYLLEPPGLHPQVPAGDLAAIGGLFQFGEAQIQTPEGRGLSGHGL